MSLEECWNRRGSIGISLVQYWNSFLIYKIHQWNILKEQAGFCVMFGMIWNWTDGLLSHTWGTCSQILQSLLQSCFQHRCQSTISTVLILYCLNAPLGICNEKPILLTTADPPRNSLGFQINPLPWGDLCLEDSYPRSVPILRPCITTRGSIGTPHTGVGNGNKNECTPDL